MKKLTILLLILSSGLTQHSLQAVTYREAKIFVPPISGIGRQGENSHFYRQLTHEVILHFHSLTRAPRGADYILRGEIEPFMGVSKIADIATIWESDEKPANPLFGRYDFFSMEWDNDIFFGIDGERASAQPYAIIDYDPLDEDGNFREYLFFVELLDPKTLRPIAQQEIIYTVIDPYVDHLLSIIIYNMLSALPDIVQDFDWRDRWLFVGGNLLWSARVYEGEHQSFNVANMGAGVMANFQFLSFLALDFGVEITQDWVVIYQSTGESVKDMVMEIPLALKIVIKPMDLYLIEPYGGVRYNFSLTGNTRPFVLSWIAGFQMGVKTGPGIFTIDPRVAFDFENSSIPGRTQQYMRYTFQIGMGYKMGFFPKM